MAEMISTFKARQSIAADVLPLAERHEISARVRRWERRRRRAEAWDRLGPWIGLALMLGSCLTVLWAGWRLVRMVWP